MGNHDFYTADPELVAREVDACGVRLLRDEHRIIGKDGGRLLLAGVDDIGRRVGVPVKIDAALDGAPASLPTILLCHRPYYLEQAAGKGVDLVLSGHTHGGQIVLGKVGGLIVAPASLASKYVAGPYQSGSTMMYVSRGIGTVGVPVRINCPPEITRITLRRTPPGPGENGAMS
jgi:predicted MPP superfamily phosphohydrolase